MIVINDLRLSVQGRTIVSAFSLEVKRGQKAVVSGPSGSGKTTLLRAVMGFVEPAGGWISIDGLRLDGRSVWQARRRMAYVSQELDLGEGTVGDTLRRPFGYRASRGLRWDEDRLRHLLSELMLAGAILQQDARSLSVGEKQRVALASSLMLERPILVLDEVTSGLDAESRQAVLGLIRRTEDLTVLAAAHDEVLADFADVVVHLRPPSRTPEETPR